MRTTRPLAFIALVVVMSLMAAVPASAARPLRNDASAGATKVSHVPYHKVLDVTNATYVDEPASTCGYLGGQSIWYKYTAKVDGTLQADTAGSTRFDGNYDTVLQVWTYDGTTWTNAGCNDDSSVDPNNSNASMLEINLTAGTTYYFQVGGYNGNIYTAPRLACNLSWVTA